MFYVTTTDAARRSTWLTLFGVDRLPVLASRPRWRVSPGEFHETEILAYDLDANRLPLAARRRFADYATQRTGITHQVSDIHGWPLRAAGLIIVDDDTAVPGERPFVFAREQGDAYVYA